MNKIVSSVGGYVIVGLLGILLGYIGRPWVDKPTPCVCPECPTVDVSNLPDTAVVVYPDVQEAPQPPVRREVVVIDYTDSVRAVETPQTPHSGEEDRLEHLGEIPAASDPCAEFLKLNIYTGSATTKQGIVHYEHEVLGTLTQSSYSLTLFPTPATTPEPVIQVQEERFHSIYLRGGANMGTVAGDSLTAYVGLMYVPKRGPISFEAGYDWQRGLLTAGAGFRIAKWK